MSLPTTAPPSPPTARLGVPRAGAIELVDPGSIRWLESRRNVVLVHADAAVLTVRSTLAALLTRLPPGSFAVIRRGVAVNLARIAAVRRRPFGDATVALDTGEALPVSRSRRPALLGVFR